MIKQNLHTHSIYDDGKDTIDEMAQSALEKGFTALGWSGHGFNHPTDPGSMTLEGHRAYLQDIKKAQEKYKGKMALYYGIEQDSLHRLDTREYDYVIGSVHFLSPDGKPWPIDYSKEEFARLLEEGYQGDMEQMAREYYQQIAAMAAWPEVDIIGHLDLLAKYNEEEEFFPFEAPWYLEAAWQAIDAGIEHGKIFEMNTGAISRGYRKTPYPHLALLQYMADHGARICINTDCHNRQDLDLGIQTCLDLAAVAGVKELYALGPDGFVPYPLEEFVG